MTARGFKPRRVDSPGRAWTGDLRCRTVTVTIEVHVTDWDFIKYPSITVLAGVDRSKLLPHLGVEGNLCYFRQGDVVLDKHRPAISVEQCLEQGRSVLEKLLFEPSFRAEDLLGEFEVYWLQAGALPVLLGSIGQKPKKAAWRTTYTRLSHGAVNQHFLGDQRDEIIKLAKAFGATAEGLKTPCWLFETNVPPAIPEAMPSTIKELFAWLKAWDRDLYRGFQDLLGSSKEYLGYKAATFAVRTPAGWLGFGFDIDPVQRRLAQRDVKIYRQYLHRCGAELQFFRLSILEVGPSFVHSRNLTHPDLRDKGITVIGCGAIGGYAAQSLVRLGAGTGTGVLRLVDPDRLLPENLGRHVLGYPSLFLNKAEELTRVLNVDFPLARIEPFPVSALEWPDLFVGNLLVDATGDEAVATALNARHVLESPSIPLLHSWILGNGEAAQALWVAGGKYACYRCLQVIDSKGELQPRFRVLKEETERRQIGCHAFTPYAISAPLQAAGLITEMVVDWLKHGDPNPRFRTRLAENANAYRTKNQNVERAKACLACEHAPQQSV